MKIKIKSNKDKITIHHPHSQLALDHLDEIEGDMLYPVARMLASAGFTRRLSNYDNCIEMMTEYLRSQDKMTDKQSRYYSLAKAYIQIVDAIKTLEQTFTS